MFGWNSNSSNSNSTNRRGGASGTVIPGSIRAPNAYTHAQHLDSYLQDEILQRSTRLKPPGNTTYDTIFQTINGYKLMVRVVFDETSVPLMSLEGVEADHHWLGAQNQVVGYAPIQSAAAWNESRILLGQAVHQVVQEFQLHPPTVHRFTDPSLKKLNGVTGNSGSNGSESSSHQHHHQRTSSATSNGRTGSSQHSNGDHQDLPPPPEFDTLQLVDMPDIPSQFSELDALDREALDQLLHNELDFQAFCHQLPIVQTIHQMGVSVIQDNAKMAEETLSTYQTQLNDLYERATAKQAELQSKIQAFQELEKEQDNLCEPVDARKIKKDLERAKKEALDESEEFADQWLDVDEAANVSSFVRDFMQIRQKHHLRAAKLELLERNRKQ